MHYPALESDYRHRLNVHVGKLLPHIPPYKELWPISLLFLENKNLYVLTKNDIILS
jgi:hypothetical protein